LYGDCKLFLSKDGFEVVRVDCSIASIPLFRIDVSLSSESIWFDAKTTRAKPDDKVELKEILRLLLSRTKSVNLVFSHFLSYFIFFSIYFHIFLFIELRVRVSYVTQEERYKKC